MRVTCPRFVCLFLLLVAGVVHAQRSRGSNDGYEASVAPFIKRYCRSCHGAAKPEADFAIDGLTASFAGENLRLYEKALEMVAIGEMPPAKAAQPTKAERERFVAWVHDRLEALGRAPDEYERALPRYANRLDHDQLFSGRHQGPAYTAARVWRMNEHIYSQLVMNLELGRDFVPPLGTVQGEGFDDYSILYADEATITTMLQNAKRVATTMVHGRLVKPRGAGARKKGARAYRKPSRHKPLVEFASAAGVPTPDQAAAAVRYACQHLLKRQPSEEELHRYVSENLVPNAQIGGRSAGLQTFLVSILLSPEFLFRMEMGLGEKLPDGRRMLSPHELAYALSFAIHDQPNPEVMRAADEGRLRTRADVEREVRAMLDNPQLLSARTAANSEGSYWKVGKTYNVPANPRLLRFFQEYFDYTKAVDVFKDDIRHGGSHDARKIVRDADWLVLKILASDRDVLGQLLTTTEYPIDYRSRKRPTAEHFGHTAVYNLLKPAWNANVAVNMPAGQRAGMLTHPAWLVAHSGNFETDPVRRGKWIQEHLLGGVVPDLPINVQAQLPEEPHRTIRERFRVVRESECWRCHKKMNPLGEPFEAYDDFGRFREKHHVDQDGNVLASVLQIGHRRQYSEGDARPIHAVDATGELHGTGDVELDGNVENAVDLLQRLAKSDRVRQVFMRHVFRYWMGRNEALRDSPTLIAMDRAYVESGGSFKETLVALMTSDSFLYRK